MHLMRIVLPDIRLTWPDRISLYVAIAAFVSLASVSGVLLAVAGNAPRGHLALYLLTGGIECEALIVLPVWLLLHAMRATALLGRRGAAHVVNSSSLPQIGPHVRSATPELIPEPASTAVAP
jgi:hypothetical protein